MKIAILFKLQGMPSGGGNQFLKSLRDFFIANQCYTDDLRVADVVLYNSHQYGRDVANAKWKRPGCIFVHRIDGPMRLYNNLDDRRDSVAYTTMNKIADCTIFQSDWSQRKNIELGIPRTKFTATIMNAPDPAIFNRSGRQPGRTNPKTRLISSCWSVNWGKGFDIYQWLDRNLDFTRLEMTFVGNTPIAFRNIRHISPMPSHELANALKKNDIYIAASRLEACSNALLEALHCGLPAIAPNQSSNPAIIGNGGEVFNQLEDIPELIDMVANDYDDYREGINVPSMEAVGQAYLDTVYSIYEARQKGDYIPKRLTCAGYLRVMLSRWSWKLHERFSGVTARLNFEPR